MERHGCYLRSNVPRWSHLGGFPTAGHNCYLRYNVPHWPHLGAVSGCAELLPAWQIMYQRQKKMHKFLDVSMDFSRSTLTSCFLSVLIKMLNEWQFLLSFCCNQLTPAIYFGHTWKIIRILNNKIKQVVRHRLTQESGTWGLSLP